MDYSYEYTEGNLLDKTHERRDELSLKSSRENEKELEGNLAVVQEERNCVVGDVEVVRRLVVVFARIALTSQSLEELTT